ncbi:MAG: SHOCT domain-containing protein [Flavobacteriales bacterium]|nr:SHOCT domain-containing protein [Flavobacteriales bacterium]
MDKFDKIKELHQLMQDGALTEAEFNAEKKKLIADEPEVLEAEIVADLPATRPKTIHQSFQHESQQTAQATFVQQSSYQAPPEPTIIYPNTIGVKRGNGFGTTGFIFSLLSIIPVVGPLFGIIAFILSIIGLCLNGRKYKKGLAIAGLIISIITVLGWILFYVFIITLHTSNLNSRYYDYYQY